MSFTSTLIQNIHWFHVSTNIQPVVNTGLGTSRYTRICMSSKNVSDNGAKTFQQHLPLTKLGLQFSALTAEQVEADDSVQKEKLM